MYILSLALILATALAASSARKCYGDIGFVIETSELTGEDGFNYCKQSIVELAKALEVGPGKDQVGLAHFSSGNHKTAVACNITGRSVKELEDNCVNKLEWHINTVIGIANLHKGMEVSKELFVNAASRNQKPRYPMLVLFAQGFFDEGPTPFQMAADLRNIENMQIFPVAMVPRTNVENLAAIAGKKEQVHTQDNFKEVAKKINDFLATANC